MGWKYCLANVQVGAWIAFFTFEPMHQLWQWNFCGLEDSIIVAWLQHLCDKYSIFLWTKSLTICKHLLNGIPRGTWGMLASEWFDILSIGSCSISNQVLWMPLLFTCQHLFLKMNLRSVAITLITITSITLTWSKFVYVSSASQ